MPADEGVNENDPAAAMSEEHPVPPANPVEDSGRLLRKYQLKIAKQREELSSLTFFPNHDPVDVRPSSPSLPSQQPSLPLGSAPLLAPSTLVQKAREISPSFSHAHVNKFQYELKPYLPQILRVDKGQSSSSATRPSNGGDLSSTHSFVESTNLFLKTVNHRPISPSDYNHHHHHAVQGRKSTKENPHSVPKDSNEITYEDPNAVFINYTLADSKGAATKPIVELPLSTSSRSTSNNYIKQTSKSKAHTKQVFNLLTNITLPFEPPETSIVKCKPNLRSSKEGSKESIISDKDFSSQNKQNNSKVAKNQYHHVELAKNVISESSQTLDLEADLDDCSSNNQACEEDEDKSDHLSSIELDPKFLLDVVEFSPP